MSRKDLILSDGKAYTRHYCDCGRHSIGFDTQGNKQPSIRDRSSFPVQMGAHLGYEVHSRDICFGPERISP